MAIRIEPTFTVDNVNPLEDIIASADCRGIRIRPIPGQASIGWFVRDDTQVNEKQMHPGEEYLFDAHGRFLTLAVVGRARTASGSLTFSQEEIV